LVWDIELDETGEGTGVTVRRALVRSRAKLDYATVQRSLDAETAEEPLQLLREVGLLRQRREASRGGITLPVPEQVVQHSNGGYVLAFRAPLPVEGWNAQISLLTGMAAAELMLEAGIGLLRTLPAPDKRDLARLRRTAAALGVEWETHVPYAEFIRTLDASRAEQAAVLSESAVLLRGAGYLAFDGSKPDHAEHSGVASTYAHVTAPLRRLADRYVGEVCVAISAGIAIPEWARTALPSLAETMAKSNRRAQQYEGGIISAVEAAVLEPSVGRLFDAVVVDVNEEDDAGTVQLQEPAVSARCEGTNLPLGERVVVRLERADVATRQVRFVLTE
jgi:exoribonuclease R